MTLHRPPPHLRQRVQVLSLILSKDQQGGFIEHWQPVFKMWMHIETESTILKIFPEIERGLRRGTVKETTAPYQGWARHRPVLKRGMRIIALDHRIHIILDTPREIGNYQSFHLGLVSCADGGLQ